MTSRWEFSAPIRYSDADIVTLDPRFASIALGRAAIERIVTGCRFTEGPVWFGDARHQPVHMTALPRPAWRDRPVANPHGSQPLSCATPAPTTGLTTGRTTYEQG
jgi:hypothetical protein